MTIKLTFEDEMIVRERLRSGAFRTAAEVIHHALVSSPVPEAPSTARKPRKNLADVLSEPPFAGSDLNLERMRDYPDRLLAEGRPTI
jgi:hypothetical protein